MTSFIELGLAEPLTRALADEKYTAPTPIQAQTIPQVLAARDVVGIAQTGTGKTAAFALPILQHLSKDRRPFERRSCRVLVLSPTRELSAQIVESFETYGRYIKPRVALAIGGVPIGRQIRSLQNGVDVLVATPGRLLDLMQNRAVVLDRIEVFVLDEADRMLDMGFIHDIRRVVAKLPSQRQTLFFSATMPREITELANQMLRDPVRVAVTPTATTAEKVDQRIIHVDRASKPSLLAELLKEEAIDRALVFTRTKHGADKVVRALAKANISAAAIHGNKSQNQRERVLASFRTGQTRILIATDIAARGIDVDGISHVFNYDLPNIPESYVHRIGRTARAGADGVAISFCDHEERAFLRDIEKVIRMAIPATDRRGQVKQLEGQQDDRPARPAHRERQGHQGQRQDHRRKDQRPRGGHPKSAHSNGAHANEGRRNEGRHQDGDQPAALAHPAGRHGPGRNGPSRNGGGHQGAGRDANRNGGGSNGSNQHGRPPQRHNGNHQQRNADQRGTHDAQPRGGNEPASPNDSNIATVAFMRPKQHHRGQSGARRSPR